MRAMRIPLVERSFPLEGNLWRLFWHLFFWAKPDDLETTRRPGAGADDPETRAGTES